VSQRNGVRSLRRAFLLAGAKSVLSTSWAVADETTGALMDVFYGDLVDGKGRADALTDAQRMLLSKHPHPFYWAPFMLTGKAEPL
jgi:CHAT domain-containing protein